MRRLLVVVATSCLAMGTAQAKEVVVPPALDGVHPSRLDDGVWQRTSIKVLEAERTVGGQAVIVWQEQDKENQKGDIGFSKQNATFLGVADIKSKKVLLFTELANDYDIQIGESARQKGKFAFSHAWTDVNGDGEMELVLTPKKGKGPETIFQVRQGALREVSRVAAMCPKDAHALTLAETDEPPMELRGEAVRAVTVAVDQDAAALRCALWAYARVAGDGGLVPADDSAVYAVPAMAQPVEAPRKGQKPRLAPPVARMFYFFDEDGFVVRATVEGSELSVERVEVPWAPDLEGEMGDALDISWWPKLVAKGGTVAGGGVYLYLEIENALTTTNYDRTTKVKDRRRDALIVDARTGQAVVVAPLVQGKEIARTATFTDGDGDGVPELSVAPAKKKGRGEAETWRFDASSGLWKK